MRIQFAGSFRRWPKILSCCLIQSVSDLGFEPDFAEASPDSLPLYFLTFLFFLCFFGLSSFCLPPGSPWGVGAASVRTGRARCFVLPAAPRS